MMPFRPPLQRGKDRKPPGALGVFLLVLLAVQGYLALTHDPHEKAVREIQQLQTWQAQPAPTWWVQTMTAMWTWETPTPVLTLTATPAPRVSAHPGIESAPGAEPTGAVSDKEAEDDK